jgi:hypothetical protein
VEGDTTDLADDSAVGRHPPISDTDVRQGRTLMTSMAGLAAAFVASGATIMTGGSALVAVIGAAAAGGGAGALAEALGRRAGAHRNRFLQEQMERGGILLWVKVAPTKTERKAREILSRCGSTDIHIHRLDWAEGAGKRAEG